LVREIVTVHGLRERIPKKSQKPVKKSPRMTRIGTDEFFHDPRFIRVIRGLSLFFREQVRKIVQALMIFPGGPGAMGQLANAFYMDVLTTSF